MAFSTTGSSESIPLAQARGQMTHDTKRYDAGQGWLVFVMGKGGC
jgi:hypothetical protein